MNTRFVYITKKHIGIYEGRKLIACFEAAPGYKLTAEEVEELRLAEYA
jgi:hypothetical protein